MMNDTEEILEELRDHYEHIFDRAGRALCFDPVYSESAECVTFNENECALNVSTSLEDFDGFLKDMSELNEAITLSYADYTKVVEIQQKIDYQINEAKTKRIPAYLRRAPAMDPALLCEWLEEDYPER